MTKKRTRQVFDAAFKVDAGRNLSMSLRHR